MGNISGTKAERFLRWLKRYPEGRTFSQCQRYVVERIRGQDYEEREEKIVHDPFVGRLVVGHGARKHRGAWADHFYGTYGSPGLFAKFCEQVKGEDGKTRYRVVKPIRPPFYRWNKHEKMEQHMKSAHSDGSSCDRYPNYPAL